MRALRIGLTIACLVPVFPVLAARTEIDHAPDPRWREPAFAGERSVALSAGAATEARRAALSFLEAQGGSWVFRVDPRTGRVHLAQGSGIELLPTSRAPGGELDRVEPRVRELLESCRGLFGPPRGELVLNKISSLARDDGRLISIYYDWYVEGVRVEGATLFARLNSGRVTQLGSRLVGNVESGPAPRVGAAEARRLLLEYSGDTELARFHREPELVLQPMDTGSGTLDYRPIWLLHYGVANRRQNWEGRVDAISGEVIGFRDTNLYGRALGGVYPRSVHFDPEVRAPLSALDVETDQGDLLTDAGGHFPYVGGGATSGFRGRFFETFCVGCVQPERALVQVELGSGLLDYGVGGQDATGNGLSTPADRNAFYHLNRARHVALKWLPRLRWLQRPRMRANVNLDLGESCNAFFDTADSSVNFYRTKGDCHNTAEVADIVYHEWGHGLDRYTQNGDWATSEGTSDVLAMQLTHSALFGAGVRIDGGAFRDLDATTGEIGLLTLSRVLQGDCRIQNSGNSPHCIGQLYGQAAWELAGALTGRHGHHTGWRLSERLFFSSLPDSGSYEPDSPLSIYRAYLLVDDDDGDLSNGTPHAVEIHEAFARHEIAGEPLPASPACPRPPQPELLVTAGCSSFKLSWPPVAGARSYEVLRSELLADTAYLPVGHVTARGTSGFRDDTVAPGVDYWYTVLAENEAGCESTVEEPVPARLPAQPVLSVAAMAVDDIPRGNRSGFVDPGEEIDLRLVLRNSGEIDATSVVGGLVAETPGVEVLEDTLHWSGLAPFDEQAGQGTLRFRTDPEAVDCGDRLHFRLELDESTGCASEPSFLDVRVGQIDGAGGHVCDDTPACYEPPQFAGLGRAAPGPSCAEIELTWEAATTRCTNAVVTYEVHRSSDLGFVPGPATRLAGGLTSTFFADRLLEAGRTYHYLVRAVDSRSGEEDNAVVHSAVAPGAPDTRPPLFSGGLTLDGGASCGTVELAWPPAAESCNPPVSYQIYRSMDATFNPGPESLVGSSLSTRFVDVAPSPGIEHSYIVRARDGAGNETRVGLRGTARATAHDLELIRRDFEPGPGGWSVVEPNDAESGNWEWGNPEGTDYQPEHDHTPEGQYCWVTGLKYLTPDGGNNDVDFGTTTLLSTPFDLAGAVDPVLRYARWFSNDRGSDPGNPRDTFRVHVSNDDGESWILLDEVGAGTPLAWVEVERPLAGRIVPTSTMRFRFSAADAGHGVLDASLVEAAIDDFVLYDRGQGCIGCATPLQPIGRIRVERAGDDVLLDWEADPTPGTRFIIYKMMGPRYERAIRIGTSALRRFVHESGAVAAESFAYRVTAVDECGFESALD